MPGSGCPYRDIQRNIIEDAISKVACNNFILTFIAPR